MTRNAQPTALRDLLKLGSFTPLLQGNALRAIHEAIWQQIVDESIRSSCRLTSLREGTLTVCADHATTASQLRYLQKILLQQLKQHAEFHSVQRLRILIKPASPRLPVSAKTLPSLSEKTAKHLLEMADSLENSELSGGFRRLARHTLKNRKSTNA
ncbi:MAG: DciA family protein [Pseudomonadota bacterium]